MICRVVSAAKGSGTICTEHGAANLVSEQDPAIPISKAEAEDGGVYVVELH